MSVEDVTCLRAGILLPTPFSGSASLHLLFSASPGLSKVAVHIRWRMARALRPSASQPRTKECSHQLVSRAALLSPRPTELKEEVSCHLCPLALYAATWNHNALPVNHKLGRISELLKQYVGLPLPLYGHESEYVPSGCFSLQQSSGVETQCPQGLWSLWQPVQLWQFITGACIPLKSKTNNHRVIIYLRSLPTTVEQKLQMCQ